MPADIDALKARIRQEVADLDPAMILREPVYMLKLCEKLIAANGSYIE